MPEKTEKTRRRVRDYLVSFGVLLLVVLFCVAVDTFVKRPDFKKYVDFPSNKDITEIAVYAEEKPDNVYRLTDENGIAAVTNVLKEMPLFEPDKKELKAARKQAKEDGAKAWVFDISSGEPAASAEGSSGGTTLHLVFTGKVVEADGVTLLQRVDLSDDLYQIFSDSYDLQERAAKAVS